MKRVMKLFLFSLIFGAGFVWSSTTAFATTTTYNIPNPLNERLKDFSVIEDQGTWHAFAMSVCSSSECTRTNSVIWHYESRDLVNWTNLGIVLAPRPGLVDSGDVWAPSVVKTNEGWTMLYTAVQYTSNGPMQRIAVATSTDLMSWNRATNNVVLDCSSLSWAYWNPNDPQGVGGDCRDPFVMWDSTQNRWLMTVSARTTGMWNSHPMVIGKLWSDNLQVWHDLGTISSTQGWVAESSHVIQISGQWFLFWTNNCPVNTTCLQWASGTSAQGPFGVGNNTSGVENWAYGSEALTVGSQTIIFTLGIGITERALNIVNSAPVAVPIPFARTSMQTRVTIPEAVLESSPAIPNTSFFLYRNLGAGIWSANEDQFIGSYVTDGNGQLTIDLPAGSYWLVPDVDNFSDGQPLAQFTPDQFATQLSVDWSDQNTVIWKAHVAGRRWLVGSTEVETSFQSVPQTSRSIASIPFSTIHSVDLVGAVTEQVNVMLSNDNGVTWWGIENGNWVQRPLQAAYASPVSEINAQIGNFPQGLGQLHWQLFVPSAATVVAVDVSLDQPSTVPTQLAPTHGANVLTMRPTFQVQATDPEGSTLIYVIEYCSTTCTYIESFHTASMWAGLTNNLAPSQSVVSWTPVQMLPNGTMTWRVRAVDVDGAGVWSAWSDWKSFTTPPAVSFAASSSVVLTTTSAEIHWTTSVPTSVFITYTDEADHEFNIMTLQTEGTMTLTDLEPTGVYDVLISSTDAYGQTKESTVHFALPLIATTILQLSSWWDAQGVHVQWQTSEPTSGRVQYGLTSSVSSQVNDAVVSTTHTVILPISIQGQLIYFQINGQGGTQYQSTLQQLTIPAPILTEPTIDSNPLPVLRTPIKTPRRR